MLLRFENAAAAMSTLQQNQERVANNLANANTTGYKRDRFFTEAFNERLDAEKSPRSDRRTRQTSDMSQGALKQTENPLDVALGGDGFFVTRPEGGDATHYTRAGHFSVGQDGTLRTSDGKQVLGEGGAIQVPVDEQGDINIAKDGTITLGDDLERREGTSFVAGDATPQRMDDPTVLQGMVEKSNVSPVEEMTDMIQTSRQYGAQQRSLQATNEILSRATQDLGKL
ncbi:MAG: flagellar basal-body rod protein FlgF [Bacteroidetes bacterium QH_7_62_13]|nr:MAG: flagellar basal-body rod protein FlgF [Bacteroidetes bacterium QH_7_62_13]